MGLRARLLLALLSLALLPTLAITLLALQLLGSEAAFWHQPAVDRALESAVEVSRTALSRVEGTVLDRADEWSAATVLPLTAGRRAELRAGLRLAGLDFAQVYRPQGARWRLADQVVPAGVLAADSLDFSGEIGPALAGDRLMRSRQGVLAGVARSPGGEVLVTGIRLTPDFFARVGSIVEARVLYGRLDVVAHVELYSFLLPILGLVLLLVAGAVLLARQLSSQMTRPLQELAGAFDRVARDEAAPLGPVRVPVRGASEVRVLAAAFNDMTGRLAAAREALARAEREAAWRDVARRLAHEIKNPLTPMSLSLHRLQRRADLVPEPDRAAVRDSLDALLQEVEHLTRLAERFSQYAKLPELEREPLELGELARAAVALHEPEGVTLRLACDATAPVSGDRLLLSRALHNLVLNACEASPRGGTVEVRVGADGREGWVEVLDRGPGVLPEVAARVFEPYVSTKNRGSGLGLSLVLDTAVKHGGRVTLENREGGGARARLVLPLAT